MVADMNLRQTAAKIKGPLVPVMPAFDDGERLDIESTCRWVNWLISSGITAFWTTYGTSHYMCLTDEEIYTLNQAVAGVTRGRAVFIASTNFTWPTSKCLDFIRAAHSWGADVVKLQVDWRWNPSQDAVFDFYQTIARDTVLPLFGYSLAAPPGKGMSGQLLDRIMELPQFLGIKNDAGDYHEQCRYLRRVRNAGSSLDIVTGGTMASFLHSHQFGARAFATAVGMVFPKIPVAFYRALLNGQLAFCGRLVQKCEEPFTDLYEAVSVSHWACLHTMLMERGLFRSDRLRFPLGTCGPEDKKTVRRLLQLPSLRTAPRPPASNAQRKRTA
jgi:4-hydroxy-tetrahydrodipicolinate synthase